MNFVIISSIFAVIRYIIPNILLGKNINIIEMVIVSTCYSLAICIIKKIKEKDLRK